MKLTRRQWMTLCASSAVVWGDDKDGMIVRSTRPEDLEMPLSGFGEYLTPLDHFFVRTHVYVPQVELSDWRLKVDGEVSTPLTFTLDDLKKLPTVELVAVVECAGNGRSHYQPTVAGAQWDQGGVGNAKWRGVRLADVLKKAGMKPSATEILFDGADVPIGTMADFQRTITVKKAVDPNTLLAFEMNGVPVPLKHGFPLRLVAPGWASDSWTKWVTGIRVLDKEFDGFWMKNAYRHPATPVRPGQAIPPDRMIPVTSLNVKSVIATPLDGAQVKPGTPISIRGVAWSGDLGPVVGVDVSTDGGRSWNSAQLGAEKSQFGWRQWRHTWTPQRESYYNIMARARDAAGNSQPMVEEWNPSGYGWNVAPRIGVEATNTPRESGPRDQVSATPPPPQAFRAVCLACHDEDIIRQQVLSDAQWNREIDKMKGWGAQVTPENRQTILDYLTRTILR